VRWRTDEASADTVSQTVTPRDGAAAPVSQIEDEDRQQNVNSITLPQPSFLDLDVSVIIAVVL